MKTIQSFRIHGKDDKDECDGRKNARKIGFIQTREQLGQMFEFLKKGTFI